MSRAPSVFWLSWLDQRIFLLLSFFTGFGLTLFCPTNSYLLHKQGLEKECWWPLIADLTRRAYKEQRKRLSTRKSNWKYAAMPAENYGPFLSARGSCCFHTRSDFNHLRNRARMDSRGGPAAFRIAAPAQLPLAVWGQRLDFHGEGEVGLRGKSRRNSLRFWPRKACVPWQGCL